MKHIHTFEQFINENINETGFKKSDMAKTIAYINKEVGANPGYALIGDDDDVKEFDILWKAKKYEEAFDLLVVATNMDIADFEDVKKILKESLQEGKAPANDATIKLHINAYSSSEDPFDVATDIGKRYNWSEKEIEKAEDIIRKKYIN